MSHTGVGREGTERREMFLKAKWHRGGSGTKVAAVPWWGWYNGGGGTMVAVVLQGWWYNALSRREMSAETQTVGKRIDKPMYRKILCVQYSCVTSSARFCEGFFLLFFVIFFSMFRLAFAAVAQPSRAHPFAARSTHAHGEAAWREAAADAHCVAAPGCTVAASCSR